MHKRRNVTGHLPEPYRASVDRKMANAYAMSSCADAKAALEKLHRELLELNPSAARSLEEGREETLTVHRLGLDDLLRCTLATTNPIESAFSVVDRVCGRVKRWRGGDQRERWVGAGLWLAEKSFQRVKGYRHLRNYSTSSADCRRRLRPRPKRRKLTSSGEPRVSTEFWTSSCRGNGAPFGGRVPAQPPEFAKPVNR